MNPETPNTRRNGDNPEQHSGSAWLIKVGTVASSPRRCGLGKETLDCGAIGDGQLGLRGAPALSNQEFK